MTSILPDHASHGDGAAAIAGMPGARLTDAYLNTRTRRELGSLLLFLAGYCPQAFAAALEACPEATGGCKAVSPDGVPCTEAGEPHAFHFGPAGDDGERPTWESARARGGESPEERADREAERDEVWTRLDDYEDRLCKLEDEDRFVIRELVALFADAVAELKPGSLTAARRDERAAAIRAAAARAETERIAAGVAADGEDAAAQAE